jgi:hypothetical protein
MSVVSSRAFTSRTTLQRVEEGDPGVGMGIYGSVMQALGLLEGLATVADIGQDVVGQKLSAADLPKRIRLPRVK